MATLIFTGGGTAGHCTPNLALLPYLKDKFDKIYYIGSHHGIEKEIITKTDIPYYSVRCEKFRRKLTLKNFSIPIIVYKGIKDACAILDQLKPDVVFSKGGYVALPTVIAAHKRKIPVISHESDYSAGLANRICARYSKQVLTTFPETAKQFNNGVFVGAPIRKEVYALKKKDCVKSFDFAGNKPILLITGGSQGSKAINSAVISALDELLIKFDIIHICGKNNLYKERTPKGYYQTEFLSDIERALTACDICISRAGSNTLFELLALKKPTVLIPLPKGNSRGDQVLNAEYFQKKGLVSVLPQKVLTVNSLVSAVTSCYANRFNLKVNFERQCSFDATKKIAEIICDYAKS